MTLDDECRLSYYNNVAAINEEHNVYLVQHTETGSFYVRKTLSVYNAEVIRQLKSHPIKDMPVIIEAVEDNGSMMLIEEYIHGVTLESILLKCRYRAPMVGGMENDAIALRWAAIYMAFLESR